MRDNQRGMMVLLRAVNKLKDGSVTYDVTYDDGDFEENMDPENVRVHQKDRRRTRTRSISAEQRGLYKAKAPKGQG